MKNKTPAVEAATSIGICPPGKTLESLLEFDPESVFLRLHHVIAIAKSSGFEFESLAAKVVVRTVQRFLAEYRAVLRESHKCRAALVRRIGDSYSSRSYSFLFVGVGPADGGGALVVVADKAHELRCKIFGRAEETARNNLALNFRKRVFDLI
jgi:hypothetical protein